MGDAENVLSKSEFWLTINNLCKIYNIDNLAISKAIRILLSHENIATDEEMYYLLDSLGLTVRPINKISGIYWQKQKDYKTEILKGNKPIIRRRITDIVIKRSMRDFLNAIYNFFSIFNFIDKKLLDDSIFNS